MELPPSDTPPLLKSYLVRMLNRLEDSLNDTQQLTVLTALPSKPKIGKIYYFKNAIPATSITGEGAWIYKSTGWSLMG